MEKKFEPMKKKLESDRRAIDKFNEKVEEWKVSFNLAVLPFGSTVCVLNYQLTSICYHLPAH